MRVCKGDCYGCNPRNHERRHVDVHRLKFKAVGYPSDEKSPDGIRDADDGNQKGRGLAFNASLFNRPIINKYADAISVGRGEWADGRISFPPAGVRFEAVAK